MTMEVETLHKPLWGSLRRDIEALGMGDRGGKGRACSLAEKKDY